MPAPSKLQKLLERPDDRPPIITITGDAGVGKTTLACLFPKAVVLRAEDGVEAIPAARRPFSFPRIRTFEKGMAYLDLLLTEDHGFDTLVVDSVSKLESIIEGEIIAKDPRKPNSINQALGGYGAGLNAAAERHRMFTEKCVQLNESGMTIIYVSHAMIEQIDPPDGDSYARFTLRMPKQCASRYIDDADAVFYLKIRTRYLTKQDETRKRVKADDMRLIYAYPTGAHVSKNRYGITDVIEWDNENVNPVISHIPFFKQRVAARKTAAR